VDCHGIDNGDTYQGDIMRTKFFALLLGCCTLNAAVAFEQPLPASNLHDFQGRYDLADGRVMVITHRGQRLLMQLGSQPEAEIVPTGKTVFTTKSGAVRLEFDQYSNGNVPAVRVTDNSGRDPASPRLLAATSPSPRPPNLKDRSIASGTPSSPLD